MCLQNSVHEKLVLARDEIPDLYSNQRDIMYKDNCNYIEENDTKDLILRLNDFSVLQLNVRGLLSKQGALTELLRNCNYLVE